jgi:UDP-glucose 4-epimerase
VIHFAASKAVGESVENPLLYMKITSVFWFICCRNYNKKQEIIYFLVPLHGLWSSRNDADYWERIHSNSHVSLWEYQTNREEITETRPKSPYNAAILLRYFNPIGSHPSAEIGNCHWEFPQNLVPFITQTGFITKELAVYGDITQLLMEPHSWLYSR